MVGIGITCAGVDGEYIFSDKLVYHMKFSVESGFGHIARIILPFMKTTS
jgi:hypothetical protein